MQLYIYAVIYIYICSYIYIYIYVAIGEKSIHRLPIYMSVIKSKVKDQQNQSNSRRSFAKI